MKISTFAFLSIFTCFSISSFAAENTAPAFAQEPGTATMRMHNNTSVIRRKKHVKKHKSKKSRKHHAKKHKAVDAVPEQPMETAPMTAPPGGSEAPSMPTE